MNRCCVFFRVYFKCHLVPDIPNVSLHHAIDTSLQKEKDTIHESSTIQNHDDHPPIDTVMKIMLDDHTNKSVQNDRSILPIDRDSTVDHQAQLRVVEKIDWKKKSAEIIASAIARKPLGANQHKIDSLK